MYQFNNQDFKMDYYTNVSTEQMEIIAIEDEAETMEKMLAAGDAENQSGFNDNDSDFFDFSTHQHYDQNINLKSAEAPTWQDCYPRGSQPIEELASFPPYRPIDHFIAAAAPPPPTSFLPSPKPPKFSYIPEPLPRITSVSESGAIGTLISLVSSSGRQLHQFSSECGTSYGGGQEARGNGNYRARRNMT